MKNKNTKYTPGPWTFKQDQMRKDEDGNYPMEEIKIPQGMYSVYHQIKKDSPVYFGTCGLIETEEDARLIAAAPELLGALNRIMERIDKEGCLDHITDEGIIEDARAAISKAEGK